MCNNKNEKDCSCIAEILTVINVLQQNAECSENCLDTCDRGFLGCGTSTLICNTRPVMLYTCCGNGKPWSMPISKENINCSERNDCNCSSVFRVEKLDGNCATFRVLAPNTDPCTATTTPYVATNSFFTMDLNCLCVIRCLQDTAVECV